jgi:hypothetical protein
MSVQGSLAEGYSTVDLLVPTSLDQLLSKWKIVYLFTKQATSMRMSTALILLPQVVFPGQCG